ncbi:MAG: hypothetical protein CL934_13155 [Deltaproteobacteria bacterium]|jgi:methanesulfonate monooxygenase small subunit|nr:hypothetical protein [Deltaproteobacteria bacterium]
MNEEKIKQLVTETIYKASLYLDDCRWADWLNLCDEKFYYAIKAFSPEINYKMTYLDGYRSDLVTMTNMLPKHNTDHSPLSRHTVAYTVDVDNNQKTATAVSSVAVYQTQLDGINSHVRAGESNVFIVGKYRDQFYLNKEEPLFLERIVLLDTRRLDKGSHWPI